MMISCKLACSVVRAISEVADDNIFMIKNCLFRESDLENLWLTPIVVIASSVQNVYILRELEYKGMQDHCLKNSQKNNYKH